MIRRLPIILGAVAALAVLLAVGPIAVAVVLLRSSPEAQRPDLVAQLLVAVLVVAVAALAGAMAWGLAHLVLRLLHRGR